MTTDSNETAEKGRRKAGIGRSSWVRRQLIDGNRLHRWLIGLLAVGWLATLGWHLVRASQIQAAVDEERSALQEEVLGPSIRASLRVTGLALGWAASESMARGDIDAIEERITRMVKEGPVLHIGVIDAEGLVRVATNKKLEGKPAAVAFPGIPLDVTELEIMDADPGGVINVVIPLVPEHERLGLAVMSYAGPAGVPDSGQ
ncbi:hypothetical protein [Haliangium sp.]|uniref:hypothetical protein n=1 Tax=Haliangium sp. TaxID=2663208 RepID=UPI003D1225DC